MRSLAALALAFSLAGPAVAGSVSRSAPAAAWSAPVRAFLSPGILPFERGLAGLFSSLSKIESPAGFDAAAGPIYQALAQTGMQPSTLKPADLAALIKEAAHTAVAAERAQARALSAETLGPAQLSVADARRIETALTGLMSRPYLGRRERAAAKPALAAASARLEQARQETLAHGEAIAGALKNERTATDETAGGQSVVGADSHGAPGLKKHSASAASEKRAPPLAAYRKTRDRYAFLAATFAVLLGLPALAGATLPEMSFHVPSAGMAALAGAAAAALGALRLALALVTIRLAPSEMKKDKEDTLGKMGPVKLVVMVAFAALVEEVLFRGILTKLAVGLAASFLGAGPAAALILATLAVSLMFAVIHVTGEFWSRVVGGAFYTALFVLSGSLLFAAAAHAFFNFFATIMEKTRWGRRLMAWAARQPPPPDGEQRA